MGSKFREKIMRKLKLQMQISVDGFVAGPEGELDWMTWVWDKELEKYTDNLTDSVDTILLGRKMTTGFVNYWSKVTEDPSTHEYEFAQKMMNYKKFVFSRTIEKSDWKNTDLAEKDTIKFINDLKKKKGKDIIVYGGADFVSSLIKNRLIDVYHLFVNPAALGKGLRIFDNVEDTMKLKLDESKAFKCGIVVNKYV
jgi:dihydrofolate reductase